MTAERAFQFDLKAEINRLFDGSSKRVGDEPAAVILMGGPATGKTTMRKQRYASGHVLIDAGDIFLSLSRGENLPFPGPLADAMEIVGRAVTQRALSERRNIVTEIIGAEQALTEQLLTALENIDYQVQVAALTCAPEEAVRRNAERDIKESISAYFAEPFQQAWIIDASAELVDRRNELRHHLSDDMYLNTRLFDHIPDFIWNDNLPLVADIEQLARRWPKDTNMSELRGLLTRLRDIGFEYARQVKYDESNFAHRTAILLMRRILKQRPELALWVPEVLTPGLASYVRHPMALEGCSERNSHVFLMDMILRLHEEVLALPLSPDLAGWVEEWRKYLDPVFWRGYYETYGC
jgi:hypothetical protein